MTIAMFGISCQSTSITFLGGGSYNFYLVGFIFRYLEVSFLRIPSRLAV